MRLDVGFGVAVAVLLVSGVDALAQASAVSSPAESPTAGSYVGELTGNNVLVRSGPSTNHYPVARLQAGTRVRVVGERAGWLTIEPPVGCFSLVHKNFVDIDPSAELGEGVVNGDSVVVRAGSEISPQLSSRQLKLNRGATVHILQPHNDDYMRIAPPEGAHVYVSARFVQRVASDTVRPVVPHRSATRQPTRDVPSADAGIAVADATDDAGNAAPDPQPGRYRKEVAEADALLSVEEAKPLLRRDFGPVIASFQTLSDQEVDAYARTYSRARLRQLRDASETLAMVKALRASGEELTSDRTAALRVREGIQPRPPVIGGGFDVVGEFRRSMIYGSRAYPTRFRLVGEDGVRTIAYVEIPDGVQLEVDRFLGRQVGVRASGKRLQTEDVDPLLIYVVSELVLLDVGEAGGMSGESAVSRKPTDG